jgi:hypothetical protein
MIASLADARNRLRRVERMKDAERPHCGACFDASSEIVDLVPFKIWGGDVNHYCPRCEEEM